VLEHMKFLYLNSELFLVSERLPFLSDKAWRGLIHTEGPRVIVGDNPILVGSLVHDLRTESPSGSQQVVRWTQPPGVRWRDSERKLSLLVSQLREHFVSSLQVMCPRFAICDSTGHQDARIRSPAAERSSRCRSDFRCAAIWSAVVRRAKRGQ